MPVTRPAYMDDYLQQLAPNEQFEVPNDGGHCMNPKCRATFNEDQIDYGQVNCPNCGFENNLWQEVGEPGYTRAGIPRPDMGQIGEKIVARMGELPGVGVVEWVSDSYHNPIDAIIRAQRGRFGCEIKTNHAQAQERFKLGDKHDRASKIQYCYEKGLKPALIGVRLNFYTDLAYIFFREGLTDTWIGSKFMMHVGTVNFADLNPFKSPDPQARHMEIDNANLPDQFEDEFPF